MKLKLVAATLVLAALAAGFWLGHAYRSAGAEPPTTGAIVLAAPRDPGDFRLVSHAGSPFTPADLRGEWTLWFFGFTHCPDVCPMTLAALNLMDGILVESGEVRPRVMMVSVDPARDTTDKLASYVPFFNPSFLGVTGDAGQIRMLTERLGIIVQYVARDNDDYTVDHGTALLLSGPDGLIHAVLQSPHEPGTLARDLLLLIPWLERRI